DGVLSARRRRRSTAKSNEHQRAGAFHLPAPGARSTESDRRSRLKDPRVRLISKPRMFRDTRRRSLAQVEPAFREPPGLATAVANEQYGPGSKLVRRQRG